MFKNWIINLSGPICDCKTENLGLKIDCQYLDIYLCCNTCGCELKVPHDKFLGHFNLDRLYPGEEKKEPEKPKLNVITGGKVIPLVAGDEKDDNHGGGDAE